MPDILTFGGGLWLGAKCFSVGMVMFFGTRIFTILTSDD